jgi:hypothetical protein
MPVTDLSADVPFPDAPFAQQFHPEFGYLSPSAPMRRKMRRAAVMAVAGMVIAASTALALVPRPAVDDNGRDEPALSAVSGLQPVDDAVAVTDAGPVTSAPPLRVTGFSAPARAQSSCDDLSQSFLVANCRFGRAGKARTAHVLRAATHRVATVPIGRIDAEPQSEPHKVVAARVVQAAAPTAAQAAAASNETPAALPPAAVPVKPPVKTVPKRERPPSQEINAFSAAAATPWSGDSRGLFFPRAVLPSLFGGADWARSR